MKYFNFDFGNVVLLLLVFGLSVNAGQAQTMGALNIPQQGNGLKLEKGMDLKQVLELIEQRYNMVFLYRTDALTGRRVSDPHILPDNNVEKALEILLEGQGLEFKYLNPKTYGIYAKQRASRQRQPVSFQQVSGTVTDASSGETLPGVNIVVKGTTTGTSTNADGEYELNVPSLSDTLVFSFIGYRRQEVPIDGRTAIDVAMVAQAVAGEELVVVGYGTRQKRDLTGSVSSVSVDQVKDLSITSMDQALQGQAAGVSVTNAVGEPGGAVSIRIRGGNSLTGSNEPLYVIDGYPLVSDNNLANQGSSGRSRDPNSNALASLNPNDIESIQILKDASATAIYGARGANGVVIITTKSGQPGELNIDYDSYYGTQEVINKIDMLNAVEYARLANEAFENNGNPPPFSQSQVDSIAAAGPGTNWQNEIFRRAPIQNHQLTLSGGTDQIRYSVSGNFFNQEGIIIDSDFERESVRANVDVNFTDRLKVGNNLFVSRTLNNRVPVAGNGGGAAGITQSAFSMLPVIPIFDEEGNYNDNRDNPFLRPAGRGNPVQMGRERTDLTTTYRILNNSSVEYEIIDGLSLKTTLGSDVSNLDREIFWPNNIFFARSDRGEARINSTDYLAWVNENTLTYQKSFNQNHQIDAVVGFSQQSQTTKFEGQLVNGFFTNAFGVDNMSIGEVPSRPSSNKQKWTILSGFGRVFYTLRQKYLFTFTARADGSSKFGEGNKWGFFPSGAFAWRLSDEEFVQNLGLFSNLKARVSFGLTGNQEIGVLESLSLLGSNSASFGSENVVGISAFQIGNPELKWETTTQLDIGLDVGFLDDQLSVSMDYYRKETDDLLVNTPIPHTNGISFALINSGSVENKGFEFELNAIPFREGDFIWNVNTNFSLNRNTVLDPGAGGEFQSIRISTSRRIEGTMVREGEPIGSFFGYIFDGIFQQDDDIVNSAQPGAEPGDIRYRDINGDGAITGDDRTVIGNPEPDFIYGITNSFSYKNFDLSFFLQGVQGGDILNGNLVLYGSNNWLVNQFKKNYEERWTPGNPSNTNPKADNFSNELFSSRLLEDGTFLRLKNITLGYILPIKNLGIKGVNRARIYVSGNNLLTFTNYSGYDPEVNTFGQDPLIRNVDFATYPTAKNILVGVNLSF